jgi:tetratricopeptide (TPR) repeat protein
MFKLWICVFGLGIFGSLFGQNSRNAQVHFDTARELYEQGNYDEAILEYKKAFELDPNFADALVECADAYIYKKNYNEVKNCLLKAIEINPRIAKAHNNLGLLYDMEGDKSQAIGELIIASDLDKKYLYNLQAVSIGNSSTPPTRGFNEGDHNFQGDWYNNLGMECHNQGKYSEAILLLEQAIKLGTTYPARTYNNLGYVYYNLGEYDKAIYYYDKALEIDPSYSRAKNNREMAENKK